MLHIVLRLLPHDESSSCQWQVCFEGQDMDSSQQWDHQDTLWTHLHRTHRFWYGCKLCHQWWLQEEVNIWDKVNQPQWVQSQCWFTKFLWQICTSYEHKYPCMPSHSINMLLGCSLHFRQYRQCTLVLRLQSPCETDAGPLQSIQQQLLKAVRGEYYALLHQSTWTNLFVAIPKSLQSPTDSCQRYVNAMHVT